MFIFSKKNADWETTEGASFPLGLSYVPEEDAYNFALYSHHATEVCLLIFSEHDLLTPILRYPLNFRINKSSRVWHCRIKCSDIKNAAYYGYKIDGPLPREQYLWHNFDKTKLLLDPYAKAVFFPPGFSRDAACQQGSNDGKAPLGVLLKDIKFDWQGDNFIHHESDLVIYELHVKGFTASPSSGAGSFSGTFSGIIQKIPHLLDLGITAVELMPVHQFDTHNSYWGYSTLNFFSVHASYCSGLTASEQMNEFKTMVRELHKAGIEIILDVVYNHTAEGDQDGPVYCYKGIDNSSYYLIGDDLPNKPYLNFAGTGNTLHTRNVAVKRLILDSLNYWRSEMHIDGFRFDLASIFNRNTDGSISFDEPAVIGMIASDPDLAKARFIAEPWDATGASHLGRKFAGLTWMQWNHLFKDDVRRFVKSDEGTTAALINRIYGSEDLFPDDLEHAFHSYQSINYINCHDGFTLYDLVAYNNKHNEDNAENNCDGADNNFSWNCGTEGEIGLTDDILSLRLRQAKNFTVLLFISNGTPMFVAGDEFLHSQRGNNNPYNQDNPTSWIDWNLKERNRDFYAFFKQMLQFRKSYPGLARSRHWRSDVQWFGVRTRNVDVDYSSHALAFYLKSVGLEKSEMYVMINSWWQDLDFSFHIEGPWNRIVNTALSHPYDFLSINEEVASSAFYRVQARSIVVFLK